RHRSLHECADAKFWPLQVCKHADRPTDLLLDLADLRETLAMLLLGAVAEVQTEDIDAGMKQRADHVLARTRRSERRHDLGVPPTCRASCAERRCARRSGGQRVVSPGIGRHDGLASSLISTARKSFTLVNVGPVTTESPSASKKPCPSLSARLSFGLMPFAQARCSVSG